MPYTPIPNSVFIRRMEALAAQTAQQRQERLLAQQRQQELQDRQSQSQSALLETLLKRKDTLGEQADKTARDLGTVQEAAGMGEPVPDTFADGATAEQYDIGRLAQRHASQQSELKARQAQEKIDILMQLGILKAGTADKQIKAGEEKVEKQTQTQKAVASINATSREATAKIHANATVEAATQRAATSASSTFGAIKPLMGTLKNLGDKASKAAQQYGLQLPPEALRYRQLEAEVLDIWNRSNITKSLSADDQEHLQAIINELAKAPEASDATGGDTLDNY